VPRPDVLGGAPAQDPDQRVTRIKLVWRRDGFFTLTAWLRGDKRAYESTGMCEDAGEDVRTCTVECDSCGTFSLRRSGAGYVLKTTAIKTTYRIAGGEMELGPSLPPDTYVVRPCAAP
jgi:hypothetical protein